MKFMTNIIRKSTFKLELVQVAWVINDIEVAKAFFKDMFGVMNFSATTITRLKEYDATYYGDPSDAENYVAMAYSDGKFIELIQPISGKSIFKDYIDSHPEGGIQHIAYSTGIINLDSVITDFNKRGFEVVSSFDTPIAKIVFFDTRKEIGVFTEIMGITAAGETAVQKMKSV
jgi:methylmalonyl-CoA/ethylmalonyl-CoA epimerase